MKNVKAHIIGALFGLVMIVLTLNVIITWCLSWPIWILLAMLGIASGLAYIVGFILSIWLNIDITLLDDDDEPQAF
jgi:uncharacterized membrane protein YesL